MNSLPNPFTESAPEPAMAADTAAAPDLTDPPVAAADPFSDEPLPLFMTEPAPELDRDIEAIVQVIFGLH